MNDIGAAGNAVHGRRRIRVPLAVVGVLIVLLAAEAVFAKSQPDGTAVVPDTVIGFGFDQRATVQVGEDWVLDSASSDIDSRLVLVHGDVVVQLSSVTVPAATSPEELWQGLDRLLDIQRRQGVDVRLDAPTGYENAAGTAGLQGDLQLGDRSGQAYVLPDADRTTAVEAQVLAPAGTGDSEMAAAADLIDSIAFEEAS
ncbi:hypothetical protein [Glycomyces tritici]|uniref:Uncharacterized protein n=1 Tax=Glycomyces tritici TaxID=2665176 RepID=A0ABT7YN89_9ACTN|nr:hypothetical protein [Glycomyces tritici]MDN3240077.1 hypothetical protein [Glycomyces tritici]